GRRDGSVTGVETCALPIYAMPSGGKLALRTANIAVHEDSARQSNGAKPGRYVRLTVSDTGSGMDADTQAHIFEPFFTTKGQGKGTGLGLSTVYGIITQSGGHIEVPRTPWQSATFTIALTPIHNATATRAPL